MGEIINLHSQHHPPEGNSPTSLTCLCCHLNLLQTEKSQKAIHLSLTQASEMPSAGSSTDYRQSLVQILLLTYRQWKLGKQILPLRCRSAALFKSNNNALQRVSSPWVHLSIFFTSCKHTMNERCHQRRCCECCSVLPASSLSTVYPHPGFYCSLYIIVNTNCYISHCWFCK